MNYICSRQISLSPHCVKACNLALRARFTPRERSGGSPIAFLQKRGLVRVINNLIQRLRGGVQWATIWFTIFSGLIFGCTPDAIINCFSIKHSKTAEF